MILLLAHSFNIVDTITQNFDEIEKLLPNLSLMLDKIILNYNFYQFHS